MPQIDTSRNKKYPNPFRGKSESKKSRFIPDEILPAEDLIRQLTQQVGGDLGSKIYDAADLIKRGRVDERYLKPFYEMIDRGDKVPLPDALWLAVIDHYETVSKRKR